MNDTTNGRTPGARPARKRGRLRRLLTGIAALLAVLAVVVAVWGPWAIGAFAAGRIASSANRSITGHIEIAGLRTSWNGKSSIEELRLFGADGRRIATLSLHTDYALLDALRGSMDVDASLSGTIRSRPHTDGRADIVEALRKKQDSAAPAPPAGPSPPAPSSSETRLPAGLNLVLNIDALDVEVEVATEGGNATETIALNPITGSLALRRDGTLKGNITAPSPEGDGEITASLDARNVTDGSGLVTPASIEGTAHVEGRIAARYTELLGSAFLGGPAKPMPADEPPTEIDIAVRAKDGRLTLTDPGRHLRVETVVPTAVGNYLTIPEVRFGDAPEMRMPARTLDLDPGGTIEVAVDRLDIPLAAGGVDWRDAVVRAKLDTGVLLGWLEEDGGTRTRVHISTDPISIGTTRGFGEGVGMAGSVFFNVDGEEAGDLILEASARGLLDEAGSFRSRPPDSFRVFAQFTGMPTSLALLDPIEAAANINAEELLGERAGVKFELRDPPGGEGAGAPAPEIVFDVTSEHTEVWLEATYDEPVLRSRKRGLTVRTARLGYLLDALKLRDRIEDAPEDFRIEGEGFAQIDFQPFTLPTEQYVPQVHAASGRINALLGDLVVHPGGGLDPVEVRSATTELQAGPDSTPSFTLDYTLAARGEEFTLRGGGTLPGLVQWPGSADEAFAFTPERFVPDFNITAEKIPAAFGTDLARLMESLSGEDVTPAVEDALASLEESLGATFDVAASSRPAAEREGWNEATVKLTGRKARIGGPFRWSSRGGLLEIETDENAVTASLTNPGATLTPLLAEIEGVRLASIGTTDIQLGASSIAVPLGEGLPASVNARAAVSISKLAGEADAPGGEPVAFTIDRQTLGIGVDSPSGSISLTMDAAGSAEGGAFTGAGALTFENAYLFDDAGITETLASARANGDLTITGLPTRLARAVDERLAPVVSELADSVDLRVIGQGDNQDGTLLGIRALGAGDSIDARTQIAFREGEFVVGPSEGSVRITEPFLRSAAEAFASDAPMRIERADAQRLTLSATPIRFAFEDGVIDFDQRSRWSWSASANGDVVLAGIESPLSDQAGSVGLRAPQYAENHEIDTPESMRKLSATLFHPQTPTRLLARVNGAVPVLGTDSFELRATDIDSRGFDDVLHTGGMLEALIGGGGELFATGDPADARLGGAIARAGVRGDRIELIGEGRLTESSFELSSPASLKWTVSDDALRWLSGGQSEETGLALAEQVPVEGAIGPLAVRWGDAVEGGYGIDALRARARTPPIRLRDRSQREAVLGETSVDIQWKSDEGAVACDIAVADPDADPGVGGPEGRAPMLTVNGSLTGLTGAEAAPAISAKAEGRAPTLLLDALLRQDGRILNLFGEEARITLDASGLRTDAESGTASLSVQSDRSDASMAVEAIGGAVRTTGPAELILHSFDSDTADWLFGSFLVGATLEKTREHKPGRLTIEDLSCPIDGDLSKLDAHIRYEPGEVNFLVQRSLFGQVLALTENNRRGVLGKSIPPFEVSIAGGVATMKETRLPVGEYEIRMDAKVDLAKSEIIDSTVFIPFSAVNKGVAKQISDIPMIGNILQTTTSIPFRISGSTEKPKIELKPRALLRKPGQIGEDLLRGAGGILDGLKKNKSKDNQDNDK